MNYFLNNFTFSEFIGFFLAWTKNKIIEHIFGKIFVRIVKMGNFLT